MSISNETRAEHAEAALRFCVEAKGETFENSSSEIVDLIADLLHLTARLDEGDEPIESTLRLARMHFEAETSNPEEQTMTTETTNEAATRKYSVLYAVTRGEKYEIEVANEEEAKDKAFTDGEFVEGGDTTDVVPCDVEEIEAFTPPSAYEHVREAAEDLLEALQMVVNEYGYYLLEERMRPADAAAIRAAIKKAAPAEQTS